jgi:hypothetical protein
MNRIVTLSLIGLVLSGCASSPKLKTNYYSHQDHGMVSSSHSVYVADRNECQSKVYAKGVMIDGKLVTTRKEAYDAVINNMGNNINSGRYGSGAEAGKPDYYKTIEQYDRETSECTESKGWSFVESK